MNYKSHNNSSFTWCHCTGRWNQIKINQNLTQTINKRMDLCWVVGKGGSEGNGQRVATRRRWRTPTPALILSRFQSQTNVRLSKRTTICTARALRWNSISYIYILFFLYFLLFSNAISVCFASTQFWLRSACGRQLSSLLKSSTKLTTTQLATATRCSLPIGSVKTMTSQL